MWLLHFFFCNPFASIINTQIHPCDSSKISLEGSLYSNCEVVSYLLGTNATENVIADAANDITNCIQPRNATYILYAQTLLGQVTTLQHVLQ